MKTEVSIKDFFCLIAKYFPQKWKFLLLLAFIIIQVFSTLYLPMTVMSVIDISSGEKFNWEKIYQVILIILIQVVFSVAVVYLMSYISQKIIMKIRNDLWCKVLHLTIEFFDKNETGEIMSRISNDTMVISEFITNDLLSAVTGIMSIIGSIILIFVVDWKMACIMLGLIPVTVLIINPLNKKLYKIARDYQSKTGAYQAKINSVLSNIRLVKSCIAEDKEIKAGEKITKELFELGIKSSKIVAVVQPLTTMIIFLLLIIIFSYGSLRVAHGSLSAGGLVAIIYYLFQIATPCIGLTGFIGQLSRNRGAMERINKILNEEVIEKSVEKNFDINKQNHKCGLVVKNLSFGYKDRKNVLKNISFSAEKGTAIAIVGESGSGKSTLFSLIERFYIQNEGYIFYEDSDIRSIPIEQWRNKIAYVQQDSPIISGTIFDNLIYGVDNYNNDIIAQAVVDAELSEFISSLPNGYNTSVGENGIKLSGGQKQRIALARAMIKNPQILLLDEATANLDSCTEKSVQRALERLMLGRITLIAAHRFSTIKNANKIVVLEKGKLVGVGKHDDLYQNNETYRELLLNQITDLAINRG